MEYMDLSWMDPKQVRPLRRSEYDQLVSAGVFEGEPIELLYGFLIAKEPQGPEHSGTTRNLRDLLLPLIGKRAVVYEHSPLAVDEHSEPEPDLALVPPGRYLKEHPTTAFLVVEVSKSSRAKDRGPKSRLYASAQIPEYWVIDLVANTLERRTRPSRGIYRKVEKLRAKDSVSLASFPDVTLAVADILVSE